MLPLAKNLNLCLRFWQRFTDLFLTVVMVMNGPGDEDGDGGPPDAGRPMLAGQLLFVVLGG